MDIRIIVYTAVSILYNNVLGEKWKLFLVY